MLKYAFSYILETLFSLILTASSTLKNTVHYNFFTHVHVTCVFECLVLRRYVERSEKLENFLT